MPPPVISTDEFLRLAEVRLRDQPHKYATLVNMLARHGAAEVRTEVEALLRGDRTLIVAFNGMLPPEHWIPYPVVPSVADRALDLMARVRERARQLQGPGSDLYESFLRVMQMLSRGHTSRVEAAREVMDLLRDHPDLRNCFFYFLSPDLRSSL